MSAELVEQQVLAWREAAKLWFSRHGRRVTIVVPSFRDRNLLAELFDGLLACSERDFVDVIVTDDHSNQPEHTAYLDEIERRHPFVRVVRGASNVGFAANVNRGLLMTDPARDVVLMNSDVVPRDGWLAALQYSLSLEPADIIAPKLLFPDGQIQFAGGTRNTLSPQWFRHLHRGKPADLPAASARVPILFASGAVFYVTAAARARLGNLDAGYPWAFEDLDYCLRSWTTGGSVAFEPRSVLIHRESATYGKSAGDETMQRSLQRFWSKNVGFFRRSTAGGRAASRVIFVSWEIGADRHQGAILNAVRALKRSGFACELWNRGSIPFRLRWGLRHRAFGSDAGLIAALGATDAVKIATSWRSANTVWRGSVVRGVPAYLVLDDTGLERVAVPEIQASFRPEFSFLVVSKALRKRMKSALSLGATVIGDLPGGRGAKPAAQTQQRLSDAVHAIAKAEYGLPVVLPDI